MDLKKIKLSIKQYRNDHPFVFYFMVIYLGGLLIYISVFLVFFADYSSAMKLNEIGDFLAGFFSPLAFLFLYLGYKQQGEALQKQGDELANSVAEQKNLIRIYEEEQREKHFQVLPNFNILNEYAQRYSRPYMLDDDEGNTIETGDEEILEISFELINYGELAKNVLIKSIKNQLFYRKEKYKLNHEECLKISLEFDEQTVEALDKGNEICNTLELTYTNIYGKPYIKYIYYCVSFHSCPVACETYIDLRVDIKNSS